jgi:FkbM family methyltransferase
MGNVHIVGWFPGIVRCVPLLRTITARVLPERLLAGLLCRVYPRAEPELARMGDYAPRGGTYLDVGVWYGPWARRMGKYADRVVAIEPNPELAALLRRTHPAVTIVQAAASDGEGEAELFLPGGGAALAGVASLDPAAPALTRLPGGRRETVRRITVDGLGLADVRLIKIDVEGHELAALRGAAATVRRDRPVLLVELEARYQKIDTVIELLAGWGYHAHVLLDGGWRPLDGFDLEAHQRERVSVAESSLLRRILPPRPRYVNMVLFQPVAGGAR